MSCGGGDAPRGGAFLPLSVTSELAQVAPTLRALRGQGGGPLKIPSNGGASVLVLLEWTYSVNAVGCAVLYGVTDSMRVPLGVCYFKSAGAAGEVNFVQLPAFSVAGMAFGHFEIDAAAYDGGEGAAVPIYMRATGLVSGAPCAVPSLHVLESAGQQTFIPDNLPALALDRSWLDRFRTRGQSGRRLVVVTLSDSTDLDLTPTDGIIIGAAGVLKLTDAAGVAVSPYLAAGVVHPIQAVRLWSTGTAAGVASAGVWAVYGS